MYVDIYVAVGAKLIQTGLERKCATNNDTTLCCRIAGNIGGNFIWRLQSQRLSSGYFPRRLSEPFSFSTLSISLFAHRSSSSVRDGTFDGQTVRRLLWRNEVW